MLTMKSGKKCLPPCRKEPVLYPRAIYFVKMKIVDNKVGFHVTVDVKSASAIIIEITLVWESKCYSFSPVAASIFRFRGTNALQFPCSSCAVNHITG